eukprot:gene2708-3359_t
MALVQESHQQEYSNSTVNVLKRSISSSSSSDNLTFQPPPLPMASSSDNFLNLKSSNNTIPPPLLSIASNSSMNSSTSSLNGLLLNNSNNNNISNNNQSIKISNPVLLTGPSISTSNGTVLIIGSNSMEEEKMDLNQLLACFPFPPTFIPIIQNPQNNVLKTRRDTMYTVVSSPSLTSKTSIIPESKLSINNQQQLQQQNIESENLTSSTNSAESTPTITIENINQNNTTNHSSLTSSTTTNCNNNLNNSSNLTSSTTTTSTLHKTSSNNCINTSSLNSSSKNINTTNNFETTTASTSSTATTPQISTPSNSSPLIYSSSSSSPSKRMTIASFSGMGNKSNNSPIITPVSHPTSPIWEVNLNQTISIPPLTYLGSSSSPPQSSSPLLQSPTQSLDFYLKGCKGELNPNDQTKMMTMLLENNINDSTSTLEKCYEILSTKSSSSQSSSPSLSSSSSSSPLTSSGSQKTNLTKTFLTAVKSVVSDDIPVIKPSKIVLYFGSSDKTVPLNTEFTEELTLSCLSNKRSKFKVNLGPPSKTHSISVSQKEGVILKKTSTTLTFTISLKSSLKLRKVIIIEVEGGYRYHILIQIESNRSLFGQTLEECELVDDGTCKVPKVLFNLKQFLINNGGLQTESIFRVPCNSEKELMTIKEKINKEDIQCKDIHCISSLIKMYFREMPFPLLNEISLDTFLFYEDDDPLPIINQLSDLKKTLDAMTSRIKKGVSSVLEKEDSVIIEEDVPLDYYKDVNFDLVLFISKKHEKWNYIRSKSIQILKSIELKTKSHIGEINNDHIFILIGSTDDMLREYCKKSMIRIRQNMVDESTEFTPAERLHLILHLMQSTNDLNFIFEEKENVEIYPYHQKHELDKCKKNSFVGRYLRFPSQVLQEYFGEEVAFYFLFIQFYNCGLVFLTVLGIAISFLEYFGDPYRIGAAAFAILIAISSSFFLESWKRVSNLYCFNWGMEDFADGEVILKSFQPGNKKRGIYHKGFFLKENDFQEQEAEILKDRMVEQPFLNKRQRRIRDLKIVASFSIITTTIFIVPIFTISVFTLRIILQAIKDETIASAVGSLINATVIQILNSLYKKLAFFLTEKEDHRTQSSFNSSFMIKLCLFQFVNSFSSLFYIAFIKDNVDLWGDPDLNDTCVDSSNKKGPWSGCVKDLEFQIFTIMLINFISGFLFELILPKIMPKINKKMESSSKLNLKVVQKSSLPCEEQYYLSTFDTFDEYNEMVIQFGYISMFGAALPFTPALALINNVFEVKIDAFKLLYSMRRPMYQGSKGIGYFYQFLAIMGIVSLITNALLIGFTFPTLLYFTENRYLILWIAVILEHIILFIKFIISYVVPDETRALSKKKISLDLIKTAIMEKNQTFYHSQHNLKGNEVDGGDVVDNKNIDSDTSDIDSKLKVDNDIDVISSSINE